jgi:hypothetical protein
VRLLLSGRSALLLHHPLRHLHRRAKVLPAWTTAAWLHVHRSTVRHHRGRALLLLLAVLLAILRRPSLRRLLSVPALRLLRLLRPAILLLRLTLLLHVRHPGQSVARLGSS